MSQSTKNYHKRQTKSDKVLENQGFVMITRARSQDHVLYKYNNQQTGGLILLHIFGFLQVHLIYRVLQLQLFLLQSDAK